MESIDIQIQEASELLNIDDSEFVEDIDSEVQLLTATLFALFLLSLRNTSYTSMSKIQSKVNYHLSDFGGNVDEIFKKHFPSIKDDEKILGYTLSELKNTYVESSRKDLISLLKEKDKNISIDKINKTLRYHKSQSKSIFETLKKYEYEKKRERLTAKYGWLSVSVLDKRTSKICLRLNNKFYTEERMTDIKDKRPPRHFRCRSILLRINSKEEKEYALRVYG